MLHPLCLGTKGLKVIWWHAPFSLLPSMQLLRYHFASPTLHQAWQPLPTAQTSGT